MGHHGCPRVAEVEKLLVGKTWYGDDSEEVARKTNPRGGQLLGEAAVSGQLNSLPGEAVPTDRKNRPSTHGTERPITVASSTE